MNFCLPKERRKEGQIKNKGLTDTNYCLYTHKQQGFPV